MWNRSSYRRILARSVAALSSMLLCAAVIAGTASAQLLPGTEQLPSGGVDVTTGPNGVQVGVDAGETGGATVGVGPGGVNLDLRGAQPPAGSPPAGGGQPAQGSPTTGGQDATAPRAERAPQTSAPAAAGTGTAPGSRRSRTARSGERGQGSGGDRTPGSGAEPVESLRAAAEREPESSGGGGVAPVFDLVERIPAAVRAGLLALALIAIALWVLWVRGRRRLAGNAYQDPETGVANLVAFEQILDHEWQRAMRYRRPLGLVLLDLEDGAGARGLLGGRGANDAVEIIGSEVRATDTVARLAPTRFAIICPEAPQGSIETVGRAIEHRLEEARLRCWAGVGERTDDDAGPEDLVSRAAAALATTVQSDDWDSLPEPVVEAETAAFSHVDRPAAAA